MASPSQPLPTLKLKLKLGNKDTHISSNSSGEKRKRISSSTTSTPTPLSNKSGSKKFKKNHQSTGNSNSITSNILHTSIAVAPPPQLTTLKSTFIPLGRQAGPAFLDTKSAPRKWKRKNVTISTLSGSTINFKSWITSLPCKIQPIEKPSMKMKPKTSITKSNVDTPMDDASIASSPVGI